MPASRCALPYLIAFRPDVILPVSGPWTVAAAKVAGWFLGGRPRIVVTGHAGWSRVERDSLRLGVDGFVAVNPPAFQAVEQFEAGRTAVRLIGYGVEMDRFSAAPPADFSLRPPLVLVVAALEEYKRVDLAVRAAAKAGMSVLVLGDGPQAAAVDTLGAQLLGAHRYARMRVPYHQMPGYYRPAHVFTLPSTEGEAAGMAIIEAMAAGLPVVVNDDPVRRWLAGPDALFVDPRDQDAFADALRRAVAAPTPDFQSHLMHFAWPTVAGRYEAFFGELVAAPRRRYSRLWAAPRLVWRVGGRVADFARYARGRYRATWRTLVGKA